MADKTRRIVIRVTPKEHEMLSQAAKADDRPVSAWIRRIAVRTAAELQQCKK